MSNASLASKFAAFDAAHGDIWLLFKQFTFDLIRAGKKHGSSDAVLHRIRWNYETSTTGDTPKINNNLSAAYARKFHREFPEYDGFFALRKSAYDEPNRVQTSIESIIHV